MKKYISLALITLVFSCQKFDRPELVIIPDPLPPAYNALKTNMQFDGNANDEGENKLKSTAVATSYTAGVSGQAIKFDAGGYLLLKAIGDTVRQPNEFVSLPADTLRNLGSFTVSFWLNGAGPGTAGAQGLFAFSHKTQFWGNLEVFLENWANALDPTEAFLKIHMLNGNSTTNNGEEWTELKIPGIFNKWSQIAITYDAATSELTVYANGTATTVNKKKLGGGNYGKIKFNEFNGLVIGSFQFQTNPSLSNHGPETWAKSFNGAIDAFRIYNRSLAASEITELYTTKK